MSGWVPAHHPRVDSASEHVVLMQSLAAAWRARVAAGHKAPDPLSREQRSAAVLRLYNKRNVARAWLADKPQRRRERLRASWRVISGGRS